MVDKEGKVYEEDTVCKVDKVKKEGQNDEALKDSGRKTGSWSPAG